MSQLETDYLQAVLENRRMRLLSKITDTEFDEMEF